MDELLQDIDVNGVTPALQLLPAFMGSKRARVILFAIGLQESKLKDRRQINGPARGLWQFEEGGGIHGVMTHSASRAILKRIADAFDIPWDRKAMFDELEKNDVWAAVCARLLMFTDPPRLPELENPEAAWNLYERVWRPGKPHPETWNAHYDRAMDYVIGEEQ